MRGGGAGQGRATEKTQVGWLGRLLGDRPEEALPLYTAVVLRAREPHWYVAGAVPDTVDGRFDAVAAVLSMVLLRLEAEPAGAMPVAQLTERFIDDMDGQLRQIGIGDIIVGKHIGRMMAMLGGRIGAYRDGLADGDLGPALRRNLYRGEAPGEAAVAHVAGELRALRDQLATVPIDRMMTGALS